LKGSAASRNPNCNALRNLWEIPYSKWRDTDAEDTLRFTSLRLREAGMIKTSPNKIVADGADWHFWYELKRELKSLLARADEVIE
jgi:NitT/TauT family transport system substrate-binding protein